VAIGQGHDLAWCGHADVLLPLVMGRGLGMAMGQVWIGYGKYPPATILAGITHTRPRLYPRVGFCTRVRTHRVSGGYRIPAGIITLHTKKHMVDK
jgi:hypothetical protein